MPTYDYKCCNCGFKFETIQKVDDLKFENIFDAECSALTLCTCPGETKVKRLIGSFASMNLKGPGFHCNDYHKKYSVQKGKDGSGNSK